ncbi:SpaA isopeptide-forming pilin-related protein [Companilactobacillus hulinensis]|uniref:SpaA isopeptide-forming pilin-related protein n=1 Tax=Companilactobacillus hulinensis TaxID=2486007 RepID=UPI000F78BE03|nr:SpaA isopeptide-forming pilin-related protein [Companilactobacillus hulinensis]
MGKKLRNIFAVVFAAMGIFVAALCFNSTEVSAAAYTSSDLISSAKIIDQDKTYNYSSSVGVEYQWDTTGTDIKLQKDDTLTMELPEQLRSNTKAGVPFDVKDKDGNVIGSAVVNKDNTVTITFNENVENFNETTGSIVINSGIGVNANATPGENTVTFPIKDGNTQDSNLNIVPVDKNITKKGVIGTDANGDAIVTWTILANRNELDLANLNVYDTITDKNLTYMAGSLTVYEATWTNNAKQTYKKGNVLTEDKYTLNETGNGFDLHIPNSNKQMYAITFQTKINDPALASDGETVFKNKAEMTWGKPGVDGETPRESASGSVTSTPDGGNSGSGGGNYTGSAQLVKKDANDDKLLPGATYSLYKVAAGDDQLIKSDLITDENGLINVSGLAPGDYYFKETKAPDGYELSNNEIPFTITGKEENTTVYLTTKDEPEEAKGPEEGSVIIQKVDKESGHKLAGAEYDILHVNEDGTIDPTPVAHITSDEYGVATYDNLPVGHYILHETKAPDDHVIGNDIEFDITENGLATGIIIMENDLIEELPTYSVTLIKHDTNNAAVLVPGATYELYDQFGNKMDEAVTDENGEIRIEGLLPGNYYFLESKAPHDYEINENKVPFTIVDKDITAGDLKTSDPRITEPETPDIDNPDVEEPGTEGPDTEKPGTENPDTEKPGTENPDTEKPGTENPDTEKPDTEKPGVDPDEKDGEDGEEGLITNPIDPDGNNNNNNGGNTDVNTTDPTSPKPPYEGSTDSSQTYLPQTSTANGILASVIGLLALTGILYFRRRKA